MGIKQYPYTKLFLKNNRRKGNAFILINNEMLKNFFENILRCRKLLTQPLELLDILNP